MNESSGGKLEKFPTKLSNEEDAMRYSFSQIKTHSSRAKLTYSSILRSNAIYKNICLHSVNLAVGLQPQTRGKIMYIQKYEEVNVRIEKQTNL